MDTLCQRLEHLVGDLTRSLSAIDRVSMVHGHDTINEDLVQAAQVLRSMPELRAPMHTGNLQAEELPREHVEYAPVQHREPSISSDETDSISDNQELGSTAEDDGGSNRAGALVRDSYGHLRYEPCAQGYCPIDAHNA